MHDFHRRHEAKRAMAVEVLLRVALVPEHSR